MTRATLDRSPASRLGEWLTLAGLAGATAGVAIVFDARLYDDFTLPKQSLLFASTGVTLAGLALSRARPRLSTAALLLLGAWVAWLSITLMLGRDPRGGILGLYQYRQGYLTQVACVILLAGASTLTPPRFRLLAIAGCAALGISATYAAVQSLGQDPISWWIDAEARPIGTIGNANELAAFALTSLGWLAAIRSGHRYAALGTVALLAASTYVVVDTQSKSGFLALGSFAVLDLALRAWLLRTSLTRRAPLLATGLAIGVLLAVPTGGASGLLGRVDVAAADPAGRASGGATRLELWEGTLRVARENPLLGVGPDGLHLAFPAALPENPGGDFHYLDLVAQSSHNWPLDIAANAGLTGLLIAVLALALLLRGTLTHARRGPGEDRAAILAVACAYLVVTALNPISLAAHAVFFVLLGYGARANAAPMPLPARPAIQRATAAAAGVIASGLIVLAALLHIADTHASRGWDALAAGRFETAEREYDRAFALMPFERHYLSRAATASLAHAATVPGGDPTRALERYDRLREHFELTPTELGQVAVALYAAGRPDAEVEAWLDRMLAADPHGRGSRLRNFELRAALITRPPIFFDPTDNLVHTASPGSPAVSP